MGRRCAHLAARGRCGSAVTGAAPRWGSSPERRESKRERDWHCPRCRSPLRHRRPPNRPQLGPPPALPSVTPATRASRLLGPLPLLSLAWGGWPLPELWSPPLGSPPSAFFSTRPTAPSYQFIDEWVPLRLTVPGGLALSPGEAGGRVTSSASVDFGAGGLPALLRSHLVCRQDE